MAAGGDNDLWNDLFGGNDSADAQQAQPPTTTAASSAPDKQEKEKKDKKGKKDKEKDKEKKDKKEKDKDGKKEAAPLPSPVEAVEPAQVAEPIKAAEPAKKEKKAGKDKDKKDKKDKDKDKEKKDKKAKKDKGGDGGVPLPADTTTPVLLPVIEDSQPAPAMEEVTQPIEKKGKEKKDKDKKDKGEKKEKKEKKKEAEDPDGKPDDEQKEKKEKKEKKDKKDKEDKKEKKEKKKDKAEEKEKKRKAEAEINEEDKRPKLDEEVAEIEDGQKAPETETADNLFDVFDMSKDLVAAEEEDPFGNIDIFDDVFAQAFAGMDEPEPEAVVQAPIAADDKGPSQRPRVEMPIVPEFFSSKKKDKAKEKETQDAENEPETLSTRWAQVMEHCKVKHALKISEEDAVPYIQDFIQSMVQAADDDLADFRRGSPMLHKMRLMEKAIAIMQKYAFAEIFVIYEGCSALAKWLNVLPNGELPNVHIRTSLLKCMMRLPITKETLANCKGVPLGAVVARLQNNPLETVANRKMAGMLVQKWLKQVLSKSQMDGFDLDQLQEVDLPKATIPRPTPETEESLKALEADSASRMHPKIPILEGKEYNIQPMPKDKPVQRAKKNLDSNRGKLAEVLKVMSRPNKKSWKPYSVCVAGRTINAI